MTDFGINIIWKIIKDILSGRATLESASALCFIGNVIIMVTQPEQRTNSMFGLLIVLLITYISIVKTKGPNKMAVSDLKDQFVEMVSTITLMDSRDKRYSKAIRDLGALTIKFNDEVNVLKKVIQGKPKDDPPHKPVVPKVSIPMPSERFGRFNE